MHPKIIPTAKAQGLNFSKVIFEKDVKAIEENKDFMNGGDVDSWKGSL